jgi:small subunit ribosomal protein S17e
MGQVRQRNIKRIARELVEEYPDVFSADFQENKQLLKDEDLFTSKYVRNHVAGYIVRVLENEENDGSAA